MDATEWDARYSGTELVWGAPPNGLVVEFVSSLPPGRALDLGCGEGRNTLWLATRGWSVDAMDFSQVGIDKARTVAARLPRASRDRILWLRGDVTHLDSAGVRSPFDLILMIFLHLPSAERRPLIRQAVERLAPGGTLLVIGHDSTNLYEGHGGPSDPEILFTPSDIVADIAGGLDIDIADRVLRPTVDGDAIDAVVLAKKPDSAE